MLKKIAFTTASLLCAVGLLFTAKAYTRDAGLFEALAPYHVSGQVAEIVSASPDGLTLAYTDSKSRTIGWVDITNPTSPRELATYKTGGEPTSVAYTRDGKWALAAITGKPARLAVLDSKTHRLQRDLKFQGQPDCVAVSPDGRFAAVAVENERTAMDAPMPQAPAGYLLIIDLEGPPAQWQQRRVNLTGLPIRFPTDPEPEYIAINAQNEAAVTLQENNAVAIVSLETGKLLEVWDCGTITHPADLQKDGKIDFSDRLEGARREPDGIAWTPGGNLITANEGDYDLDLKKKNGQFTGGRNFTISSRRGEVLYDSGNDLEQRAAAAGAYDDDRSRKKGVEPEGVAVWQQDGKQLALIACERAMGGALYDISDERAPRFVAWLKTGAEPEGVTAIPARGLLVTANEGDGTISLFRRR